MFIVKGNVVRLTSNLILKLQLEMSFTFIRAMRFSMLYAPCCRDVIRTTCSQSEFLLGFAKPLSCLIGIALDGERVRGFTHLRFAKRFVTACSVKTQQNNLS